MNPPVTPLNYYPQTSRRVHSWLGIVSAIIPLLIIALYVVNKWVGLQNVVGNVADSLILAFIGGFVVAVAALVEAAIRRRRLLLPPLSIGFYMAELVAAIVLFIIAEHQIQANGGPR